MTSNQMCRADRTCDNGLKETTVDSFGRAGRAAARVSAALALGATMLLTGCQNFFVCDKASCPSTGTTGSSSGDYVYISNSSSGSTYISGYDIGSGSLTAITNSPFNLDFQPVAMTVSPSNSFLYVASLPGITNPGIYLYTIDSTGQLSGPSGGGVLIGGVLSSMDISPDGNYLFAVSNSGTLMSEYQVNTSTGGLSLVTSFTLPGTTCALAGSVISQTCSVKVSPNGYYVAVSLGTAGTVIYPYTSSSGITTAGYSLIPSGSTTGSPSGDYSVTLDSTSRVYIARTNALSVWQISDSAGDAAEVANATYNSGVIPRSVVLSNNDADVYTANEGAGTISAYSIGSNGALTVVSGAPFAGPSDVSALGVDKSGSYMVAAGYNSSSGVQLFSISSTGALTLAASTGSGTSTAYPVVLAMTH